MASDFVQGLAGVSLGGALAIAGSALQSYLQGRQSERRFGYERRLAEEDHKRRQVVLENQRVRGRMETQLTYGRCVMIAAMRFKAHTNPSMAQERLRDVLAESIRYAGLDFDAPSPFGEFLTDIEIEDDELRDLVGQHRRIISDVDATVIFADARPEDIPKFTVLGQVDQLARRIEARYRVLQREGRPL